MRVRGGIIASADNLPGSRFPFFLHERASQLEGVTKVTSLLLLISNFVSILNFKARLDSRRDLWSGNTTSFPRVKLQRTS